MPQMKLKWVWDKGVEFDGRSKFFIGDHSMDKQIWEGKANLQGD
jgi:hypothetical protein